MSRPAGPPSWPAADVTGGGGIEGGLPDSRQTLFAD